MIQIARTALFAVIILLAMESAVSAQRSVDVTYDDGRASERVEAVQLPGDGEAWFLRATDVARLFRANQFWNASSRKVVLGVGRTRFILTVDTRVVVVDGEPIMLRTPVRYEAGFVLVPIEFVVEIAAHYTPRTLSWDARTLTLSIEGLAYNVEKLELSVSGDRTTATINLAEPLLYHLDTSTQGIVRLKLYGGRIDVRAFSVRKSQGLVEGIRAEQTDRDAFIYFDVRGETRRVQVDRNENPHQLVLVLEKGELPDIPDPEFGDREVLEIVDRSKKERSSFEIKTIILDPGHGGKDLGKTSDSGLLEKDINLQIAQVVRRQLREQFDVEVFLTREDDRLLGLTERTEIANAASGDLFISIHCNAWFSSRANGFEAYFLSPARSESDRAIARFENASGGPVVDTPGGDVDFILWDLVQNEFVNESSTFAEMLQRAMDTHLEIRSRGVKQANFAVLQGAKMPAVLIEAAFLSNPQEAQMLTDAAFHRRIADGVVEAVRGMKERYR